MRDDTQQFVCPHCGASRLVSAEELPWATCFVCGGGLTQAGPAAAASQNETPYAQPVESATLSASTPTDAEPERDSAEDDNGDPHWIDAHAGWLVFLVGVICTSLLVIVVALGDFRIGPGAANSVRESSESASTSSTCVNAKTSSVRRNGVKVKIADVVWGKLRSKDETNVVVVGEANVMIVRIEITNQIDLETDFPGWRAGSGATLTDSVGREYRLVNRSDWTRVQWAADGEDLPPGETVRDVVVFDTDAPVELREIEWMRFRAPAAVFGGTGDYWFEIPSSMISALPDSSGND